MYSTSIIANARASVPSTTAATFCASFTEAVLERKVGYSLLFGGYILLLLLTSVLLQIPIVCCVGFVFFFKPFGVVLELVGNRDDENAKL
jgi:ABC-type thiamin/hydroxymethylpyrimidine transport system permease subunit